MLRRTCATLIVAGVVALFPPLVTAADRRCDPVDEASRRPDFFSFRAQLQRAVADHDADALLNVIDPRIRNTFGGNDGIEAFRRIWRIDEPRSALWRELGAVLALGGSFDSAGAFVAPYTFGCGNDAFDEAAVIGADVSVRAAPSAQATVIETLTFAMVRLASEYRQGEWTQVELEDGRKGFVATRYIRSPIDYRAYFTKAAGRWRMTMFIAGD